MPPWPSLEPFSCKIHLEESEIDIFYYDSDNTEADGTKPVCLLLHGLADEADTWRHVLNPLSGSYRMIAPDLPGFGRSGKPKIRYSIPYFCEVIRELLKNLNVESAVFAGSSLGGMICQYIALGHPSLVDRLILIDGLLLNPRKKMSFSEALFLTPGIGEYYYSSLRNRPDEAYQSLMVYYADLEKMPEEERSFLYERVSERVWNPGQSPAFFSLYRGLKGWLHKRQTEFREAIGKCNAPTLIIWGERDRIIPVKNAESLIRIQKSSRLVIIPGAGHLPHQEQPALFLECIRSFLNQND